MTISLIDLIDNNQFTSHFSIDVCREDYSATFDMAQTPDVDFVIELLESKGFDVIHEESTIYTVTYET